MPDLSMIRLALATALLLAGCAGTDLVFEGQVCGQPVKLTMHDAKDRSAFDASATCPQGGGLTITSSESSTSQVLSAMSANIDKLTALVGALIMAPAAGIGWAPGSPTPAPEIAGMTYVGSLP